MEVLVDEDSALEAERRRSVNFSRPMPHQPMRQCASSVGLGVMAEREAQLPKQIANGHLSAAARGHLHAWSVEIDAEGVPVSRPGCAHLAVSRFAFS